MPHKPLRQIAAEKARGNKPANPSQLGDPIDLKAETSDGPDPVETAMPIISGHETRLEVSRSVVDEEGSSSNVGGQGGDLEKVTVVGIGDGAGPVGGVVTGRKSKL